MLRVTRLLPGGLGLNAIALAAAATLALDWDVRQKSRFDALDSQGRRLGVFLPWGSVVRGGDVLEADDSSLIQVIAAAQPVLCVRWPGADTALALIRAAYHLGNRHVPLALEPDQLKLEPDHVLAAMLETMGYTVVAVEAAFEPESGAYGGHHGHR